MTNLKELEAQVKKEELELEKAKSDLAKAKKGKKKSSSGKSKKEKQREIEERLKKVDLRAAMGELGIYERQPNPALYEKELIEKASLMEMDQIEKAAASFLDREKNKDEEKKLKREVTLQQLESLGLDINSLKELIKG